MAGVLCIPATGRLMFFVSHNKGPLFQQLLRLLPTDRCVVLNLYGSTEVAGDATCAVLPEEDLDGGTVGPTAPVPVPCGRAIDGVQVGCKTASWRSYGGKEFIW